MKQFINSTIVLLGGLLLIFGCVQHEEFTPSIADLALRTGVEELLVEEGIVRVTSQVEEVGDGITVYGHFWSADRANVTRDEIDFTAVDSTRTTGSLDRSEVYADLITCSRFNPNETYFIRAYTIDRHGSVCAASNEVEFLAAACGAIDPCNADFVVQSENPCIAGCEVEFEDSSVNQTPVTVLWDYGDGSPEDNLGRHTYEKSGQYTVTLTLLDEDGTVCDSVTKQDIVTIQGITFGPIDDPNFGPGVAAVQLASRDYLVLASKDDGTGGQDFALIKVSEEGTLDASFNVSFDAGVDDEPAGMIRSGDNIFIVGTATNPATNDKDFVYIKVKENGEFDDDLLTPKFFGEVGSDEIARGISLNSEENIVIVGETSSNDDIYVAITDPPNSGFSFRGAIPLSATEVAHSVVLLPGGEIGIIGYQILETSEVRGLLLRRRENGQSIPGVDPVYVSNGMDSYLYSGTLIESGEIVMGGISLPAISNLGDILLIGGPLSMPQNSILSSDTPDQVEIINAVANAGNSSFVAVGRLNNSGFVQKYMIKDGNILEVWSAPKITTGISDRAFNAVIPTQDCGFLAVGLSGENLLLFKVDGS